MKTVMEPRMPGGCELEMPRPFSFFLFGATGDLARKKILPALYQLSLNSLLPEQFFIMGIARSKWDLAQFREEMRQAVKSAFPSLFEKDKWRALAEKLFYSPIGDASVSACDSLLSDCAALEKRYETFENRLFYLAVPPLAFESLIKGIGESRLKRADGGYTHIVIEKPHGRDLGSARRLTALLGTYFRQDQIYFMDHYLAKETVQNILIFRFANSIFEPLWNNRFIDHVQITVAETIGIEKRAGYYEQAGVLRDMFQNHLLQLLALIAMEPPSAFESEKVRDEKAKVLASVKPFPLAEIKDCVAVGQYGPGSIDGRQVAGYRNEPGVSPSSTVATYASLKVLVENWRWNGVPFYLRSGKRLATRKAEIAVHFRPAPFLMFAGALDEGKKIPPNVLKLRIQPHEGIGLFFETKMPGSRLCLKPAAMDFSYSKPFAIDDYARILLDAMQGDRMLFVRADAVEKSWQLLTPLIDKIESAAGPAAPAGLAAPAGREEFPNYAAGSEGPAQANELLAKDGRAWDPLL